MLLCGIPCVWPQSRTKCWGCTGTPAQTAQGCSSLSAETQGVYVNLHERKARFPSLLSVSAQNIPVTRCVERPLSPRHTSSSPQWAFPYFLYSWMLVLLPGVQVRFLGLMAQTRKAIPIASPDLCPVLLTPQFPSGASTSSSLNLILS